MEIFSTSKIDLLATYDIVEEQVVGKLYSKIESSESIYVGDVSEDHMGFIQLSIFPPYSDKSYISEDFEKLKGDFINYASFWHSRESRGIC